MEPSERQTLCFVSWNVHGVATKIGSKRKFDYVSEELIRQHAEIVFLQETHIGPKNCALLNNPAGFSHSFFTVYGPESKGVAIMIRDGVPFEYICHDEDYSGGYIVLFCYLHNELFTLVNVYNHKHDKEILNRLKDYLRETAEGVLLIGGDFNTVMDLTLDRKSKSLKHRHTPLRDMFEKFTASLNLMDAWVHLNPTTKAFTRSQNESFSRLDMFLMPVDIIERVSDVKICKANMIRKRKGSTNMRNISDHDLVALSLTLRNCSRKKTPMVASFLKEFTYSRDDRAGKINGAEILSAINSLTDSRQVYHGDIRMELYKKCKCPMTEILKIKLNELLYSKKIPVIFKTYNYTRKHPSVWYVIFTMILAKRLRVLLLESPTNMMQPNTDCFIVTFSAKPVRIKWTFLMKILSYLYNICKTTKTIQPGDCSVLEGLVHGASELTEDFSILDSILPPGEFRELQEGSPLTRCILSLVLKYLEFRITNEGYYTHICQFRQAIVAYKKNTEGSPEDLSLWGMFSENGIKLSILNIES